MVIPIEMSDNYRKLYALIIYIVSDYFHSFLQNHLLATACTRQCERVAFEQIISSDDDISSLYPVENFNKEAAFFQEQLLITMGAK